LDSSVVTQRSHPAEKMALGIALAVAMLVALLAIGAAPTSGAADTGIVASAVKAPITPDGDVAGAPTDFVIAFDRSLDPSVAGRTLLTGDTIKVTLPDDFVNTGGPVTNPGPPPSCPPPAGTCSTGVMLQGWPQHPIPPSPANYTVGLEGTNTIVFTATTDLVPSPPFEPGIKQLHLILRSFVNPQPGRYELAVEAQTGPGGAVETGVAIVHIRPDARASVNVTSAFNAGTPNTIYQQAALGAPTPLPYDFLLWDKRGEPAVGVDIRQVNENHAQLVEGRRVVGQITIDSPAGASGQSIGALGPSTAIIAPVLNLPTALLTAQFVAGDTSGRYTVTVSMNNGTSVQMFVDVA
ncbi:MAG: hypothetical protein OEU32_13750, partial [Acidimicrobiia bacterium]|nr:hypothetical protein [Acidimicrobiia bacterium]